MRKIFQLILVTSISILNCSSQTSDDYRSKGISKYLAGDYPGAMADFSKGIELNPLDASSYSWRGLSKHYLGDHRGGISDFDRAIELDSKDASYYSGRGDCKVGIKDYKGAMEDFNNAIYMWKDSMAYPFQQTMALAYLSRCNLKGELKDYRGAILDCNMAIKINPDLEIAYISRGCFKISLGEKDNGCLDLSKAGELGFVQAYDLIKQYCN